MRVNEHKRCSGNSFKSISILIGGAAGMGIATLESILNSAFKKSGFYVYSTKEFMSRVRGGSNTTLIRISNALVEAPCWEVDISVALDALALEHMQGRCHKETVIFADEAFGT
ncbi:MAG: 2-oxoacid:acceptor oxidoreductase family protein, partial [Sulfurimonas sp.]